MPSLQAPLGDSPSHHLTCCVLQRCIGTVIPWHIWCELSSCMIDSVTLADVVVAVFYSYLLFCLGHCLSKCQLSLKCLPSPLCPYLLPSMLSLLVSSPLLGSSRQWDGNKQVTPFPNGPPLPPPRGCNIAHVHSSSTSMLAALSGSHKAAVTLLCWDT